jgi:non-ribosomal peptide synthetase component F
MIVSIFAVLKAGGAYVPLDPSNPISRLSYIANNVDAVVVLTSKKYQKLCSDCNIESICIDTISKVQKADLVTDIEDSNIKVNNLAYVIFTSGSTGEPKGVMIEHSAAVNSVWAQSCVYKPEVTNRFLQYSNYTFDASIGDIFIPMTVGACIVLAQKEVMMNDVAKVIRECKVDCIYLTNTVASMVDPDDVPNLKLLAVGAEPVTRQVIEKWAGKVRLLNIYGKLNFNNIISNKKTNYYQRTY